MRISGFPVLSGFLIQGSARDSDSGGDRFLKGLLALDGAMDFPLLGVACANDASVALC